MKPGEPTFHANDTSFLAFIHYNPTGQNYLLEGDPVPNMPLAVYEALGGKSATKEGISSSHFWLVLDLDSSTEYQRHLAQWFDGHHKLLASYDFYSVKVRCYANALTEHQ